jgi:hypothetical protein
MMPHKSILTVAALMAARLTSLAADEIPKPQVFARYEPMMNKSPFAVATAVAPPPAAPTFAKDLYIANAARLADEGVVTLQSGTDKNLKEYCSTTGPNKNGYSISNIDWSDRVGATKVTITKDGQFATLTFNQALLSQPVVNAGQAPQQPQPAIAQPQPQIPQIPQVTQQGVPVPQPQVPNYNTQTGIKPAPIPTLPTPPPRVRGVIPRPNSAQHQNAAQAAGQIPQQPDPQALMQDQ